MKATDGHIMPDTMDSSAGPAGSPVAPAFLSRADHPGLLAGAGADLASAAVADVPRDIRGGIATEYGLAYFLAWSVVEAINPVAAKEFREAAEADGRMVIALAKLRGEAVSCNPVAARAFRELAEATANVFREVAEAAGRRATGRRATGLAKLDGKAVS